MICIFFPFFHLNSLPAPLAALFLLSLCQPGGLIRESSWGQGEWSLSLSPADLLAPQTPFISQRLIGQAWQLRMGTKKMGGKQTGWQSTQR